MKTLLLGASAKPHRYAYKALEKLRSFGHEVYALGNYPGQVGDVTLQTQWPEATDFDTVTVYLNSDNQKIYADRLIDLHPRRVIFNPGSENRPLAERLMKNGIQTEEACTLVLLSTGQF